MSYTLRGRIESRLAALLLPLFACCALTGALRLWWPLELCGLMALVGVAMEIGIEPTARHAADLGIVPVIIEDACGSGHAEAAQRSIAALKFAGDAVFTEVEAFCNALRRKAL